MNNCVSLFKKTVFFVFILLGLYSSSITAKVIQIGQEKQYLKLVEQTKPTVVQFASNWCGVCQEVKKPFEQVAHEPEFNHITFARVDIDTLSPETSQKNNIVGIPTFVFLNNGQKKDTSVGVKSLGEFKDELRGNLRKNLPPETLEQIESDLTNQEIKSDKMPQAQKEPVPHEKSGTFWEQIKAFFLLIIKKVAGFIKMIFDYIKGLFDR